MKFDDEDDEECSGFINIPEFNSKSNKNPSGQGIELGDSDAKKEAAIDSC